MWLNNKIRFNIAIRLSLIFFSVFILAVGIIYLYVVPQLESKLTDQKLENLDNFANLYSDSFLIAYNNNATPLYLDLLTQQYAERADARIMIIDAAGELKADSLRGQGFNAADYPIVSRAATNHLPATDVSRIDDRNYGMAAVPIGSGGQIIAVIVVSSSMSDVESAVSLVKFQLSIGAGVALVIALAAIYLASQMLARRIQRIESGAVQIAQGNFAARVPVASRDELGQLAKSFNEMGDKLGSAFRRIDVEKQRAKLLLDDLSEGVIGIDTEGRVIVANPAAERLLGHEIAVPVGLEATVPEEIFDLWRSMNQASPQREDTFMLDAERALQVHSSFLSDQAELASLLVLRDVSQEVKLEQSRRDFIANASHELKTPIFSLSGFLEILHEEEVDEETKQEFMATMREQVERLAALARDLLDLSRMDSGAVEAQMSRVELKELVESVAREFAAHSVANKDRIKTEALPAALAAYCDRDRTTQLVRILLDNALKYSPPHTSVEVSGSLAGESVSFAVTDHGAGIPEKELTRVFERFYRGKGAARIRGTGLGLAIARELTKLMNGTIRAESSGEGTTFVVTLAAQGAVRPPQKPPAAGSRAVSH